MEYVKYLDYNNRNANKYINSSLSDSKKNNSSDSEKNTVSRLRSKSVQIPKKNNQYDIVDSNNSSRLESDDAEIVNYNNIDYNDYSQDEYININDGGNNNIDYDNFSQDEETNDSDN